MASQDNEKAMDGLLRRSLARDASPNDDCPNAELLAAYHERSLGADEIAGYELHFSQCSRCREQLAAMVRAASEIEAHAEKVEKEHALEPALITSRAMEARPPAATMAPASSKQPQLIKQQPSRPGRTLIDLRWLLPVAAALVLTALVYVRLSPRHPEVASNRELAPPPQPAPPHLDPNAFDVFPKSPAAPTANSSAKKRSSSPASQSTATPPASTRMQSYAGGTLSPRAGTSSPSRGASASKSAVGNAARPPSFNSPQAGKVESAAEPEVAEKEAPAEAAAAAPPPESKEAMANSVTSMDSAQADAAPAPPPPAEPNQKSETAEATHRNLLHFGASNSLAKSKTMQELSAEIVIHSPDPKVLYRISSGGFIERSTDAGATWLAQLLNAAAQFTAGSAPAPQVCWLAGRAGIIYRTDDGKNWKKVPSPAVSDFTAVIAKDGSSATVTASDGKIWSTGDAGETWTPAK